MRQIPVKIEKYIDDSYEVEIGSNLLEKLAADLCAPRWAGVHKFALITDSNVAPLYGEPLLALLRDRGLAAELFVVPAGEEHKTREEKAALEDRLLASGFRRDSCVIALGGGVVTDLAGFVAATYCRGVPVVNYATTFLAAADASIGGKTAVDVPLATNMIGLIVQPKKVYIDLATWETLDEVQFANGLSETIKHACMADADFFARLEAEMDTILDRRAPGRSALLEEICERNVRIKYAVVSQDESESGLRQILNLGHTVGRAAEAAAHYGLQHGQAVSIGMAAQLCLGEMRGYVTAQERARVVSLYRRAGLPVRLPENLGADEVIERMYADKKVRRGQIKFVFQKGIGAMMRFGDDWSVSVEETEIREALKMLQ